MPVPDRNDPDYWRARPADHGVTGLYREGPQEASNVLARLIAPCVYTDPVPPPAVARQITEYVRTRARQLLERRAAAQVKLLRALAGERVRTSAPRTHARPSSPQAPRRPQDARAA
jgi:hypothetical protein